MGSGTILVTAVFYGDNKTSTNMRAPISGSVNVVDSTMIAPFSNTTMGGTSASKTQSENTAFVDNYIYLSYLDVIGPGASLNLQTMAVSGNTTGPVDFFITRLTR